MRYSGGACGIERNRSKKKKTPKMIITPVRSSGNREDRVLLITAETELFRIPKQLRYFT